MNPITDVVRPLTRRTNRYFHDYQDKLSGVATEQFLKTCLEEAEGPRECLHGKLQ